jgi:hypothetical protein
MRYKPNAAPEVDRHARNGKRRRELHEETKLAATEPVTIGVKQEEVTTTFRVTRPPPPAPVPTAEPERFERIRALLRKTKFSRAPRANMPGTTMESLQLGLVPRKRGEGYHISTATLENAELTRELTALLRDSGEVADVTQRGTTWGGGKAFTTIFVGKNNVTPPHVDGRNKSGGP